MGYLWGQLCWRSPPDATPDLLLGGLDVKEKWIRDPGLHRAVGPSSEGGSPQHPLALVRAAPAQGQVSIRSSASGQGGRLLSGGCMTFPEEAPPWTALERQDQLVLIKINK